MQTCILCFEDEKIFGIGFCNHGPICFKCTIKCRTKMNSIKCSICKEDQDLIIMQIGFESFQSFDQKKLKQYEPGILYIDQEVKNELDSLNVMSCWIQNCKDGSKYNSIGFLKRHLKEKHNRHLCEVCVENKTALLKEQKLYTQNALEKHLKNGDYDDDNNLIFFHPYCQFCNQYFYNEEFYAKHMNKDHFSCHLCGTQEKFRFYNKYQNLETHFKMSHYLCMDQDCLQKKYIVYKYPAEIEMHNQQYHLGNNIQQSKSSKNYNITSITGFHYQKDTNQIETVIIKDKEGVDCIGQFISQRRIKESAAQKEWKDIQIDIRDLKDEEEREVEKEVVKEKYSKQKYSKDAQVQQNQITYIDDIQQVKYTKLPQMDIDDFDKMLKKKINSEQFEKFCEQRTLYFGNKIDANQFFQSYVNLCSPIIAYQTFPYFISCIPNNQTSQELDNAYYQNYLKLPSKKPNLMQKSPTYLQLFNSFLKELEIQILKRIEKGEMGVYYPMENTRFLQLVEIIKRAKVQDMGRLKYASNFGVEISIIHLIKQKLYTSSIEIIQEELDKLEVTCLLSLFLYLQLCSHLIQTQTVPQMQFTQNILFPILDKNPVLKSKDTSKIDDEEVVRVKVNMFGKNKYVVNEVKEKPKDIVKDVQIKQGKVIQDDKFEFPTLENENNHQQQEVIIPKVKPVLNNDWVQKKNQNPFLDYDRGRIKTSKELSEQFPDLAQIGQKKNQQKQQIQQQQDFDDFEDQSSKGKQNKKKNKPLISGFF